MTTEQLMDRPTLKNTKHSGSAKYSFVSTGDIVDTICKNGVFEVTKYREAVIRDKEKVGMQFHEVRLCEQGWADNWVVGSVRPELVLSNSYNCSKAFEIGIGAYRKVCSNGLCLPDGSIEGFSSRHINFDYDGLMDFLRSVPQKFEELTSRINILRSASLSSSEQLALAVKGYLLRHNLTQQEIKALPMDEYRKEVDKLNDVAPRLLRIRRYDDNGSDAWSVFNRIQENLMKGVVNQRRVTSLKGENRLNKELWAEVEMMVANQ